MSRAAVVCDNFIYRLDGTEQEGLGLPTLEFKGMQHIYARRLTVAPGPPVPEAARSPNPAAYHIVRGENLTPSPDCVYQKGPMA